MKPELNLERCDSCGLCMAACHCGAIILIENIIQICESSGCDYCGACEVVCSQQAISCGYGIVEPENKF